MNQEDSQKLEVKLNHSASVLDVLNKHLITHQLALGESIMFSSKMQVLSLSRKHF